MSSTTTTTFCPARSISVISSSFSYSPEFMSHCTIPNHFARRFLATGGDFSHYIFLLRRERRGTKADFITLFTKNFSGRLEKKNNGKVTFLPPSAEQKENLLRLRFFFSSRSQCFIAICGREHARKLIK